MVCSMINSSIIFHFKPMDSNLFDFLEKTNQIMIVITAYFMLFCTEWLVLDPEQVRYDIGFLYSNIIIALIVLNFVTIIFSSI